MTSRVRLAAIAAGWAAIWAVIGGAVVTVTAPTPTPSTITRVETVERVVVVTPPPTPIATPRIAVPVVCDRVIRELVTLLDDWRLLSDAWQAIAEERWDDPAFIAAAERRWDPDRLQTLVGAAESCAAYPRIEP
jgi:hypothetical protein